MSENNPQGKQIQIKATDEKLAGVYSNMLQITHSKEEFVLDFVNLLPPSGQLVSRILVSPTHAKRIMLALQENIKKYESQFEKIDEVSDAKQQFGFQTE